MTSQRINFERIAAEALSRSAALAERWLPDGRLENTEWVARNPLRFDRHYGSMKVNLRTGKWADFATGDGGRDLIALAAFLFGLSQAKAAVKIAQMLGLDPYDH